MIPLSTIDKQNLSTIICNHLICMNCGIVDRDMKRLEKGYKCKNCNFKSNTGRQVFPINITILVDLLQQTYHAQTYSNNQYEPQSQDIGTILFYCSLRESLLNTIITNNLRLNHVKEPLIKKIFSDNKLAHQKFGDLFKSVFDIAWQDAVSELDHTEKKNFSSVSDLMIKASKLRNNFLHDGKTTGINRDFSKRCIDSLDELILIFVALHNKYNQPLYIS